MLTEDNWTGRDLLDALGLVGEVIVVPAPILEPRTLRMLDNAVRASKFVVLVGQPAPAKARSSPT